MGVGDFAPRGTRLAPTWISQKPCRRYLAKEALYGITSTPLERLIAIDDTLHGRIVVR